MSRYLPSIQLSRLARASRLPASPQDMTTTLHSPSHKTVVLFNYSHEGVMLVIDWLGAMGRIENRRAQIMELAEYFQCLRQDIAQREIELDALREVIKKLEGVNSHTLESPARVVPGQFKGKRVNVAARDYISQKGAPAAVEELIKALPIGGCDLGKASPRRKVILGVANSKYLELRDGLVYVLTDPEEIAKKERTIRARNRKRKDDI